MQQQTDPSYEFAPDGLLVYIAHQNAYIALLERAVVAAREQRDLDFYQLLPEIDERQAARHEQDQSATTHLDAHHSTSL